MARIMPAMVSGKYFAITMANDCVGYDPPAYEIEKGAMKPGDAVQVNWMRKPKKCSEIKCYS